jgi:nitrite reductase (cytochrome c-552)
MGIGIQNDKLEEAPLMPEASPSFLIDFVEAENSTGIHAPQEAASGINPCNGPFAAGTQIALKEAISQESLTSTLPGTQPESSYKVNTKKTTGKW